MKRAFEFVAGYWPTNKRLKLDPQSLFHQAIKDGDFKKVEDLIKAKSVDVNLSESSETPLTLAIRSENPNRTQIIRLLVLAGAETRLPSKSGLFDYIKLNLFFAPTPIDLALQKNDQEVIGELLTSAIAASPFAMLPNEILSEIFKRVPKRSLVGDVAISQVCQFWNFRIKHEPRVKTPDEILASCHSREEALSILRDEALCRHLTKDEMLSVISWVDEVAEFLIKNHSKCFNYDQLGRLAAQNYSLGQWIIDNKSNWGFLSFKIQVTCGVAKYNLQTALEVFPKFLTEYLSIQNILREEDSFHLSCFAEHPEILEKILESSAHRKILISEHIRLIAKRHGIGLRILNIPEFLEELKGSDLFDMGFYDPSLIKFILGKPELVEKLTQGHLFFWCYFEEVEKYILSIPALKGKMGGEITGGQRVMLKESAQDVLKTLKERKTFLSEEIGKEIYPIIQREIAKIPASDLPTRRV